MVSIFLLLFRSQAEGGEDKNKSAKGIAIKKNYGERCTLIGGQERTEYKAGLEQMMRNGASDSRNSGQLL